MWFIFALLSAITAALASIFAKVGLENVNSNLATAIRTIVILFMTWGIVYVSGAYKQIPLISERNWWFIIFSGLVTKRGDTRPDHRKKLWAVEIFRNLESAEKWAV